MNEEYKPITNLWKDSEGYRYFGTLKLSSKIKYDGDDFIPLWEWFKQLQQENKILKENAENNDKVVDKVNWENMLLKKENKQFQEKIEYLERSNDRREDTILEQRQEISDLEDNWIKLKKYIKTEIPEDVFIDTEWFVSILDKMQELEGSDSNE